MKLSKIAAILGGKHTGGEAEIERVGTLDETAENAILYIEKEKFLDRALSMEPAALVVPAGTVIKKIPFIEVADPRLAFIKLLEIFAPPDVKFSGISSDADVSGKAVIGNGAVVMRGAVVMENAHVGAGTIVYPGCVVEPEGRIGRNTILYPGAVLRARCEIGDGCIIHPGAVIGSDGFSFYEKNGVVYKIPQIGNVKIGNRVEIGANCAIDRATVGATVIGDDTKLDNLVHIAHNVKIGKCCYIMALAGISGSVTIGDHVAIMGQAGVGDHLTIPDGTVILGQSGVTGNVRKPDIYFGTPLRQIKEHHKIHSALRYLPGLLKRVKLLEDKKKGEKS